MAPKQSRKRTYGKTQKRRSKSKTLKSGPTLTIPELRSAMQGISVMSVSLAQGVKRGALKVQDAAREFADAWSATFGRKLDISKAKSYIMHVVSMEPSRKGKQTRRKQRGGSSAAPAAGAPLGYQMGPGADLPNGAFPKYISNGFVNPEPAILQDCGKQTGVLPYPSLGSNKVGGGMFSDFTTGLSAIATRPFISQNPPSMAQDGLTAMRGQPLGPGSQVTDTTYQYRFQPLGQQPIPVAAVLDRSITGRDIIVR